jgi:hypothetical protein
MYQQRYKSFLIVRDQNQIKVLIFAYFLATGLGSVFAKADPDPGEPNQCGSGSETLTTDYIIVRFFFCV